MDRNRHKGCTMAKAMEQGIRVAQLPLADYIAMGSYSRVLTARFEPTPNSEKLEGNGAKASQKCKMW